MMMIDHRARRARGVFSESDEPSEGPLNLNPGLETLETLRQRRVIAVLPIAVLPARALCRVPAAGGRP